MIDVIMTMFNPPEKAIESVNSLIKYREGMNRLIIVDNASKDKTNIMKLYGAADLIVTLKHQASLAAAWNTGVSFANTDKVVISNDDILFTENWLPPIEEGLNDKSIGVLQPYNTLGALPDNFPDNYKNRNKIENIPKSNFLGCCFGFRKDVINKLKLFDQKKFGNSGYYFFEEFYPISAEDQDFYLRLQLCGYKNQTAFNSYVHHYSGETCKTIDNFDELKESVREKFIDRWGSEPHFRDFQ